MTNAEIKERISRILGTQGDTSAPEGPLVDGWIYEGIVDILARTRPNMRVINLALTPNVAVHDMSQSIIALLDLEDDSGFLDRYSREDITGMQRNGGRGFAYEEPLLWVAPVSTEARTIKAYGVFRPNKMVVPDDSPSSPSFGGLAAEFHPYIVTYALWKGGEYTEHEGSGLGEKWRIQYEGENGQGGELSTMKRTLLRRATPKGTRRRDPTAGTGVLSSSDYYLGG